MNSIKTSVVVIILLGVLYGVYRVLNVPERPLTPDEQSMLDQDDLAINPGTPIPSHQLGSNHSDSPSFASSDLGLGDNSLKEYELDQPSGLQTGGSYSPNNTNSRPAAYNGSGLDGPPANPNGYRQGPNVDFPEPKPTLELGQDAFRRAMQEAEAQVQRGELREALEQLTMFYDAPSLPPEDQQLLTDWLDALAGKVIYSSEHLLERPYIVRQEDTLVKVAGVYRVPPQLLHNINRSQINSPNVLLPGSTLKVLRGPFEARVNVEKEKLTLFLENGRYYAGQFRANIGNRPLPPVKDQPYIVRNIFPPNHWNNPYRDWWIDLGAEATIHPITDTADPNAPDSVGLTSVDMADLASILDQDCRVYIRR